jgi:hypothetical protein
METAYTTSMPERVLWLAVINQAFNDALAPYVRDASEGIERRQARSWFRTTNPDFKIVCELAELNPQYVFDQYIKAAPRRQRPLYSEKPFEEMN